MTPAELTSPPELSPSPRDAKPRANAPPVRRRLWLRRTIGLALFAGLGFLAWSYFAPNFQSAKRSEILLHKVKAELLPIAVVEKGTLESAENRDVICKVKAGGMMIMKPLLFHSSARSTNNQKRRVIHLEFSNLTLPDELHWAEKMNFLS